MVLEEKLTEEEKKEIITEIYMEYLQGMTSVLLYKLKQPLVHSEKIFNSLEKRIPLEVERKRKPILRFLSMYLEDLQYLLTKEGTLKSPSEIKRELQRIFTIKLTGNTSNVIYPPNFSKLERVTSFHEVNDLDEIMECGTITIPHGLAISKLGVGAGGSVYKVYRNDLKQFYALKIVNIGINEKEAELMAKLKGQDLENIVQIHDAGNHLAKIERETKYALLMEYVDGQTLEKILKERKLSTHEVLDYSAQILNGIQSLRRLGITHRDLNPRNIKLNSSGKIKILDFGIATDEQSPKAKDNRRYGAPEGNKADDLFSFGLLLYKMATGEHIVYTKTAEIGEETYAKNIAQLKSEIYLDDGNLKREYREKIAAVGVVPYKPLNGSETMACITPEIRKILVSCFEKEEIDKIKHLYPEPFYFYLCSRDELIDILWKGGFSASLCAYIQKRQK